ncbi:Solute carrier family 35 member F5, partial [Nibea albiflora]
MEWVFIMNRMSSQGSSAAQRRRMALGVVILLLVDVIWVASSELTSYIFKRQEYNKPFFSTFTKTSMFVLYLLGFLLWRPWRQQCTGTLKRRHSAFFQDVPAEHPNCLIGDCESVSASKKQRVRFSNIMEVRQLPSTQALEAKLSRMSYPAAKDHEAMLRTVGKLTITDVAKISFFFCFVWFLANLSYQEALSDTQVAIVNILSSTSGLFTLILAAIFPSNSSDRFTLSKLLAVALSMGGVALVSFSSMDNPDEKGMIGFVGLFNLLLLWPGFLLLHYTGFEAFELPSQLVWTYILINGLIGTVLSEFLWLWGCFLTSSLIGTLALSLTIPLSIMADICMQKV